MYVCFIFKVIIFIWENHYGDFSNILRKLWDRPLTSWSPNAKLLRTLILPLLNSNTDTNLNQFAEAFTILMTVFQRRYEFHQPSACAIGDVSNYLYF